MDEIRLLSVLAQLRRRGHSVAGGAAIVWCGVTFILALVAAAWFDLAFELPPSARMSSIGIAALIAAAVFVVRLRSDFQRFRAPSLARRLDTLGRTGGQILTGVDLAGLRAGSLISAQPALSAGLATMAVRRAANLAGGIEKVRVVPVTPVLRAMIAAAVLTACLLGLAWLLPGPATAQWLRFRDPYGDHPLFSTIQFRIEPGQTSVRYGDSLDVFVTVEGRLADTPQLVLQPRDAATSDTHGQAVPMFQEPSGRWRASLAEVKRELRYFVRARRTRSHKFLVGIVTVPAIEKVEVRLTPPAYSRLPVYDGTLPDGGLAGLAGTQAQLTVRSNRPLQSARVRFFSGERQLAEQHWPAKGESNQATGTIVLDQSCRLEIQVLDIDRQLSRDTVSTSLVLLPDERPFVRLLEPKAISFATPSSRLPVSIVAEDDFGVARIDLFRSLNESRYSPLTRHLADDPQRRAQIDMQLPLEHYGLAPGDEIKLFARVEDNDPAGAKGAESPVVTIRIISEEEFARMIRTRNGLNRLLSRYQEAERRLESVAEEMEHLEKKLAALPPGPLADETRQELQQLAERMSAEAEAIAQLGRSPLPYDLDKALSKNLDRLADQLGELADKMGELARSPSASKSQVAEELERLRKQLAGDKEELATETGPPLEWLTAVYPLLEDEARFTELYQRQRDLAERLSALRGKDRQDDPSLKARMRDLEAEQQRLQTDLTELLDDIDEHAKRLPKKPEFKELRLSAEVFAMLVRRSEAEPTMVQAAVALSQFAGTEGHDQALRAADILESFLAKCQGIGEQGTASLKNSFEPSLGDSLGSTLSQLLADSGFGQEGGLGAGRGGGYSARRNSLGNIGLYGGLPAASGPQGGQQRGTNPARGAPGYSTGSQAATGDAAADSSTGNATMSGAEASVPSEYRRRVGRYFQRLADELGNGAER